MNDLDALLRRWVGEPDESRAQSAFADYYSAAFPALVRHVQLRTGWDRAAAEDIAQEALLRFFGAVGRGLTAPTNGYLFEIATTTFLDEMRRRARRKRGGPQSREAHREADPADMTEEIAHPLQAVESYESVELLERFHEHLRAPVDRAVRALEQARAGGRALAQQRRLDSVSRKFARTMAVLSLMGEGCTQEETARRAGLSRNQVKYIVESVKEAYARFAGVEFREPRPRPNREGESHAS